MPNGSSKNYFIKLLRPTIKRFFVQKYFVHGHAKKKYDREIDRFGYENILNEFFMVLFHNK